MIITYNYDPERTYLPKAELPPNPERMVVVFAAGGPVALLGHIGPMLDIALQEFPEALVKYAAPDGANGLLIWEGHVAWAAPYGWAEDGDYVPTGKWRAPTAEEVEYIADDCWPWDPEQWLAPDQPKDECPRCAMSTVAGHRCAFVTGTFDSDNWNCGTMNALRAAATGMQWQSSGDEHSVLFDIEAFDADVPNAIFLVLQWYKRRGRTTSAVLLGEHGHEPLTLEAAETIIEACKRRGLLDAKAATAIDLSGIDLTGVEAVDGLIDEVEAGLRSEPRPSHGFTTIRRTATGETFAVPAPPPYMADTMRPDVSLPGEPPEVSTARRDWMAAQHGAAYNGWRPEHPAPVEALRAWLDAGEPLTYPDACALLDEIAALRAERERVREALEADPAADLVDAAKDIMETVRTLTGLELLRRGEVDGAYAEADDDDVRLILTNRQGRLDVWLSPSEANELGERLIDLANAIAAEIDDNGEGDQ